MKKMMIVWLLMAVCAVWSAPAMGAYHHMDEQDAPKFLQAYPDKAGTKLDDCASCHKGNTYTTKSGAVVTESVCQYCHSEYGYDGSGDITKTLNPYGADYNTAGRSVAALAAIEGLDSDNDTYSNITEINAIRYPGDPLDTPAKEAAPHIILSRDELESVLTPHEQFMLMNTSRGGESGFDYYITYTGFIMQDLLEATGWTAASSGITVTAPDGYSYTYARTSTGTNYPIEGTYPQAQYFYDATADSAYGGWVDYSAPGCLGRTDGQIITVDGGLKLLLAYKANGTYLDIAYQDDQNKLVGEGPFRAVPPQWNPGYPDRQATSPTPDAEPWPYDKNEVYTDHNAGFSARGVAAIRVDPLPEGTTEYDWRNSQTDAGWGLLNEEKIVIYGNLRNGTIKGTVVSKQPRQPLANALVKTGMGGYETHTDINGQFMLSGVVAGPENNEINYTLIASAEGYRSQTEDVTVIHGEEQTVEFSLEQGSDAPMVIDKATVKAGKSRGADSMKFSGTLNAAEDAVPMDGTITLSIVAADIPVPAKTTFAFPVNAETFKKGKYTSPKVKPENKADPIVKLSFDTIKGKLSFSSKNLDLTGVSCPITIRIQFGDYVAEATLTEDEVNGTKPCPPELMEGI